MEHRGPTLAETGGLLDDPTDGPSDKADEVVALVVTDGHENTQNQAKIE